MTKITNRVDASLTTFGARVVARVRAHLLKVEYQPSAQDLAAAFAYAEQKVGNAFADFLAARMDAHGVASADD